MTERIYACPLCPWAYVPSEPAPNEAAAGIARALGLSAIAVAADWEHTRLTTIERDLKEHLQTHPVEEWATEVRRLRDLVGEVAS